MNNALDEYRLEDIAHDHRIGAGIFVPFVIARLLRGQLATESILTVILRDAVNATDRHQQLRLHWSLSSVPTQPFGIQERTVTEWAALGLASVVLARYTSARISQVAANGDRFDFWVSNGNQDLGLEVSGTMTDEIEARHRAKVRQWRENPYETDGYVIVAGFAENKIICSFHRFEEEMQ